ncbi:MAG: NAD-dependent epimerase/dehydratase family protein [Planctomycetaceae bacterium]
MNNSISRPTISGACGNLGWKLLCHLVRQTDVEQVFGLSLELPTGEQYSELRQLDGHEKVTFVRADLTDHADQRWREVIEQSDAVVHFAAQNPYPEATWNDANNSLDMTLNVANAAVAAGVERFVFASSNHVMGRYKDLPLSESIGAGELTTGLDHAVGTVWTAGAVAMDSTIYAVAKSAGERACRALALQSGGRTEFVCTRIGWCQPGENLAATLSGAGTPTQDSSDTANDDAEAARNDRWFKLMWLSNRDFLQLHSQALFASSELWPEPCIVVNAMSQNEDMVWSLKEASRWLGYNSKDGFVFS